MAELPRKLRAVACLQRMAFPPGICSFWKESWAKRNHRRSLSSAIMASHRARHQAMVSPNGDEGKRGPEWRDVLWSCFPPVGWKLQAIDAGLTFFRGRWTSCDGHYTSFGDVFALRAMLRIYADDRVKSTNVPRRVGLFRHTVYANAGFCFLLILKECHKKLL